jgi:hypothetical protein
MAIPETYLHGTWWEGPQCYDYGDVLEICPDGIFTIDWYGAQRWLYGAIGNWEYAPASQTLTLNVTAESEGDAPSHKLGPEHAVSPPHTMQVKILSRTDGNWQLGPFRNREDTYTKQIILNHIPWADADTNAPSQARTFYSGRIRRPKSPFSIRFDAIMQSRMDNAHRTRIGEHTAYSFDIGELREMQAQARRELEAEQLAEHFAEQAAEQSADQMLNPNNH